MADFSISFSVTMKNEGTYSNNPNDKGGETYAGVSRKNWPSWAGWPAIDHMRGTPNFPGCLDQSTVIKQLVGSFYKVNFWDVLKLDQFVNQPIATELFDLAVNCGVGVAGAFLQRSINVLNKNGSAYPDIDTDGNVGALTVKYSNEANQKDLLKCIIALQGARYISICENNKTQEEFMAGWIRRAFQQVVN